ncbi:phosphotransferase [Microtetraspora fusca]|uniref:phosphotransferase n=1 Tax=Microtetraspora fusca TaxID=1997 RepID=UPI00082AB801|nr:phosphotransferase [Microtetraspora fusca]
MDSILRAAGDLLDTELSDPIELGGSRRSTVVRCRTASGGSVIVKAFSGEPEGLRSFASEAAGLSLRLAGPELIAVDAAVPLLVLEDLGDAPTLADLLLGDDPKAAATGLLAWARGLGRLAAGSVPKRADLARLRARYDKGVPSWEDEPWIERNFADLLALLDQTSVAVPKGLAGELAEIGAVGAEYLAFTPGDTCPDNNLLTQDGLRLIDFEAACFQSVFLTAAYCRMPFSTCWCVFRLPTGLAEGIERAFRAEVVNAYPELAGDAVWQAGVRRAIVVWTVDATVALLPRTLEDGPLHPTRRPVPTRRQLLEHRWGMASTLEEFPALAATMRTLLRDVARGWETPPLQGYPAFSELGSDDLVQELCPSEPSPERTV